MISPCRKRTCSCSHSCPRRSRPSINNIPNSREPPQGQRATGTTTRQGKKPKFHDKKYHKLPLPERPSRRSSVYGPLSELGGYAASADTADTADTADSDPCLVNDSGYVSESEQSGMTIRPAAPDDGGRLLEVALRPSDSCSNYGQPEAPAAGVTERRIPLRPAPHRTGTLPQQRQILHADSSHTYHQQAGRAPSYASPSISAPSAVPTTGYEGDDDRSESISTYFQSQADTQGVNYDSIKYWFETDPLGFVVEMMEKSFENMKRCLPEILRDEFDYMRIGSRRLKQHFFARRPPGEENPPPVERYPPGTIRSLY